MNFKELCYYLFFGLMIAAKGMGLDSGDRLYYLLSAVAGLFLLCKLCLTRYSVKELAMVGLLCLLGLITFLNSGRPGLFLSILALVGMKDMKLNRLFRLALALFAVCFFFTVVLAAGGVIANPMAVHEKGKLGEVIRWGMGYSTGNVFHLSFFILTVLYVRQRGKGYGWKDLLLLTAGNGLVFLFSLSYTGVAVTFFYLLLNLYAVRRKVFNRVERLLCYLPLPFFVLFSLGAPFLTDYPPGKRLNALLQARLGFSRYFLENQPITLLGTRMRNVPNFWVIMDNGYVYILMTFGLLSFLLFFGGYALLVRKFVRQSAGIELSIIFSFLLYGIMEQFISNAFMNVSILYMGGLLFKEAASWEGACEEKKTSGRLCVRFGWLQKEIWPPRGIEKFGERKPGKKEPCGETGKGLTGCKVRKGPSLSGLRRNLGCRRKRIVSFGLFTGLLVSTIYFVLEVKPVSVAVPLKALPYADAQTVLLHTKKPCGSEQELKERMEAYAAFVQKAAESEDKKRAALLEFSLPQSVYESKSYDTFRIRLFHGNGTFYGNGTEENDGVSEKNRAFLEELLKETVDVQEQLSLYADPVYEERVGKDFGTDRIEHVKNSENYRIEKTGTIVRIEVFRTGILRFLLGLAPGLLVAAVIYAGKAPTERHGFR